MLVLVQIATPIFGMAPMANEPHKLLGVRQDASETEIKDAYRKKAKRAHPDAGGSSKQFDDLKRARDKMLGEDGDPDQGRGPVLALIAHVLQNIIGRAVQEGIDLKTEDVVNAITILLKKGLDDLATNERTINARRDALMDIIDRFETKKEDGDNVLRAIAIGTLSTTDAALAMSQQQKAIHDAALALVKTQKFRRDLVKVQMQQAHYQAFGYFQTGSST